LSEVLYCKDGDPFHVIDETLSRKFQEVNRYHLTKAQQENQYSLSNYQEPTANSLRNISIVNLQLSGETAEQCAIRKRLAKPSDKHSRGFTYSNSHFNDLTFSPTNFRETVSLKGTGLTRFPGSSIYKTNNRPPQVLIFMYFPTWLQLCQDSQLFFR
jgi:hypothetical protein